MSMAPTSDHIIFSSREIKVPVAELYQAFADPASLARWWGPEGFTNTIHEFDLRPGGKWILTMHGPEVGNYQNASTFTVVEPHKKVCWTRSTQPLFDMEVGFEALDENRSKISFKMLFATVAACAKVRNFAGPKNEENFDRLERLLADPNSYQP